MSTMALPYGPLLQRLLRPLQHAFLPFNRWLMGPMLRSPAWPLVGSRDGQPGCRATKDLGEPPLVLAKARCGGATLLRERIARALGEVSSEASP